MLDKAIVTLNRDYNHEYVAFDEAQNQLMTPLCEDGVESVLQEDKLPLSFKVLVSANKPTRGKFTVVEIYDREEWVKKNAYFNGRYQDVKIKKFNKATIAYDSNEEEIEVCAVSLREFIQTALSLDNDFSCEEEECYYYYIQMVK